MPPLGRLGGQVSPGGSNAVVPEPRSDIFSKTKMCKFKLIGVCIKGSSCMFAHTQDELKPTPDLFRTKICKTLINTGACQNPQCRYAHNKEELRTSMNRAKPTRGKQPNVEELAMEMQERPSHGLDSQVFPVPVAMPVGRVSTGWQGADDLSKPRAKASSTRRGRRGRGSKSERLTANGQERCALPDQPESSDSQPSTSTDRQETEKTESFDDTDDEWLYEPIDAQYPTYMIKNTFLEFGPDASPRGLKKVHTAAGRLEKMAEFVEC
ncbi:unnamed protein product [Effrenium voratum]|uniref:C3H1-type domain-containing protein n=1 Tax=Effrenium voratum TaxID=2562239 RepID=A0AA36HXY9_9DINO|nr:unnamed protein product [Effrenium voratum]|mmetsp:Transcript_49998/g.119375  ORF Transcript_49998/g.119375 Transcript_49998/m.119375 type:complete len:267 (-) Transcript_49998:125-925(-)|eukprot:CAMPEP_0181487622 /NCGR_PEP_ID=MMETSP1110-20121109/47920_1 /TAXON_ID=174948 /ORGANISM="Symbiodinium sp., Strain CCMP421" /LENGTH=266 /DNA_ID=CAMNT_0023614147 /DNA_START=57 /DNA_END=857 /DNA_ORIENTATION=+